MGAAIWCEGVCYSYCLGTQSCPTPPVNEIQRDVFVADGALFPFVSLFSGIVKTLTNSLPRETTDRPFSIPIEIRTHNLQQKDLTPFPTHLTSDCHPTYFTCFTFYILHILRFHKNVLMFTVKSQNSATVRQDGCDIACDR